MTRKKLARKTESGYHRGNTGIFFRSEGERRRKFVLTEGVGVPPQIGRRERCSKIEEVLFREIMVRQRWNKKQTWGGTHTCTYQGGDRIKKRDFKVELRKTK